LNNNDTKKTQEIAKERKAFEDSKRPQVQEDEDVKAAEAFLKSRNYLTRDEMLAELESFQKKQKDDLDLQRIIENNPSLKQHEEAIRKIAQVDNSALEDIVTKYNFLSSDKLTKAKSRDIVGGSNKDQDKQVDIDSMTPEQWAKFKAEKGIGQKGSFTSSVARTLN
jgi:hypothetical protein